ncbi:MAG: tyrosine--tRNA ligase [Rickettsiales bacterium]|nr:tyrosine--tRNA ligase [Rickettsiales bacterium]|tara:strand:+ start:7209 stop:8384 length:1176 start_codon:yes stop_codon:yes gene_type:complete
MKQISSLQHVELIPESTIKTIEAGKKMLIKFGADPSAKDLHLGHCVVLFQLQKLQEMGHHVQFIIGDFTAKIGDPTGKSETRKPLTNEEIAINAKTYQEQVFKILDPNKTTVYYNSEWLEKLTSNDLIQLAAKYNVARMMERDDFEKRFKQGQSIGIHEFLYPLLQGYDSVILKSDLEIGGTDQKFNLLVGRHLQREYQVGVEQAIMTMPILEGTDGVKKMSKSLQNHIAIDDEPEDMFGKIMSIPDVILQQYISLLTDESAASIKQKTQAMQEGSLNPRDIKVELGQYIVKRFYSEDRARDAYNHFQTLFKKKEVPDDIPEIQIGSAISIANLVVEHKLLPSKKELYRLVNQGAVSIDNNKITDMHETLKESSSILKIGKRKLYKIILAT